MLKCDCASNRSHIPSSLRVNTDRGLRRSFAAFSIIFWPTGCGFAQKPLVSISGFLVYYGFENPARQASEPRIGRSQFQGWAGGVYSAGRMLAIGSAGLVGSVGIGRADRSV